MGLKEAGLRGSLRNASSVLPAFFDVTVTNTNSPVREGDVLSVDYSANNTGDVQDTQDIRLEIDSVEEDRDSNVTLAGGVSTTGTLQWDTTNENATTYTATVLSNDDSDSVTVEVESAIPDSVVEATPDNTTSSGLTPAYGMQIESTVEWPSIGVEISSNTTGVTLIEVYDAGDGTLMGSTSTSPLSGGDTATIDGVDLQPNTRYNIVGSANGSSWTRGWINDYAEMPKSSPDGQLTMELSARGPTTTERADHRYTFSKIGNVGFA